MTIIDGGSDPAGANRLRQPCDHGDFQLFEEAQ
jgi:hypothetical protein